MEALRKLESLAQEPPRGSDIGAEQAAKPSFNYSWNNVPLLILDSRWHTIHLPSLPRPMATSPPTFHHTILSCLLKDINRGGNWKLSQSRCTPWGQEQFHFPFCVPTFFVWVRAEHQLERKKVIQMVPGPWLTGQSTWWCNSSSNCSKQNS